MPHLALITDFGLSDWFVGEMKGIIAGISPGLAVIDITHQIPPGDVRAAAFALLASYRSFPKKTVFCVVVDSCAGPDRKGIVAETGGYLFVGPDNGVLSWVLEREEQSRVYAIGGAFTKQGKISATFRGRDVFGPVAAHCATGTSPSSIGPSTDYHAAIPFPFPSLSGKTVITEIIAVDRFGNAITSIDRECPEMSRATSILFRSGDISRTIACRDSYSAVPAGEPVFYRGSAGYFEIGVNSGNAADLFGLFTGARIELEW